MELTYLTVTDEEIGRTFGELLLGQNPAVLKLYDYAPYLLVLTQAGEILASGTVAELEDLRVSNMETIYHKAVAAGVEFEGMTLQSDSYLTTAFAPNSPWVKMILDPSVPGPVIQGFVPTGLQV